MARPYVHWKPSANAALHVRASEGPVVLTDLDAAMRKLAISPTAEPCALFEDANIWYAQKSDPGDLATPSPVIVMGYQVLPSGLAFWAADPVSGAPLPVDVDDANGLRFLALGHRCTLRGWIGTVADTLTGILKARWNDTVARNPADPRGAWTGVVVFSFDGERQAADQLAASLQGKRPGDANWLDYGCHLNRPIDPAGTESHASAPSADTDAGSLRVIVTGASPAWTVNIEKWDTAGMVWAVVHSVVIDLRANGVPGSLTGYGLIGALVSAATVPNPGGPWPPVAPYDTQEIAIDRVEVSQFEPWVPDIAEWSRLDWQHMLAAIGLTFPVNTSSLELRRAPVDLLHMPMGHAAAPAELRASDADLGIGVRMTKDTTLWAQGRNDTPLMSIVAGARDLAICAQDAASCGYEAPFAAAVEIKPENMVAWVTDRWILQIDNPLEGAPNAASNGMGVFWRAADEKLVARAYHDGVGWVDLTYDFPRATWEGRAVTIAICWSGYSYGAGNTAGRPDYEFRLVVDGVTRASTVIGVNFRLQHAGPSVTVGAGNGGDGFTGFFSQGALFGEVMGDLDIRAAFEEAQSDFANPEFEDPAVSARGRGGALAVAVVADLQRVRRVQHPRRHARAAPGRLRGVRDRLGQRRLDRGRRGRRARRRVVQRVVGVARARRGLRAELGLQRRRALRPRMARGVHRDRGRVARLVRRHARTAADLSTAGGIVRGSVRHRPAVRARRDTRMGRRRAGERAAPRQRVDLPVDRDLLAARAVVLHRGRDRAPHARHARDLRILRST
jgi:hypothetical protein